MLPHGTTVRWHDDRVVAVEGVGGQTQATLAWNDQGLERAELLLPDHRSIVVAGGGGEHPVFGPVDRLCDADGATVAFLGRIDWQHPQHVPPVDRPGALPTGAGAAVLNLLAIAARVADVEALRYRGPYPTAALFDALLTSFTIVGDLSEALAQFTANVERTAVLGAMVTVPVALCPAPFEWDWPDPRVCVQRREGIERIYVDGRSFDAQRRGPRRVLPRSDGGVDAVVMVGERRWATVVSLDGQGKLLAAPAPLPSAPPELVGESLPAEVQAVVAEVVARRAGAPLSAAVREVLLSRPLVWADPGLAIVRAGPERIELHAGLVSALPTESEALLGVLMSLIEPTALALAQARLAEAHDALTRR